MGLFNRGVLSFALPLFDKFLIFESKDETFLQQCEIELIELIMTTTITATQTSRHHAFIERHACNQTSDCIESTHKETSVNSYGTANKLIS